jgi:hypothetical protein
MATIRFALSAIAPGTGSFDQWDLNWTPTATQYQWSTNGGPLTTLAAGAVSLPGSVAAVDSFNTLAFGGSMVSSPTPLVTVATGAASGASYQNITLDAVWNTIKDIEVSNLDTQALTVTGFVDTWIQAAGDNSDHVIEVDGAKRGEIALGNGNDTVGINFASNETSWSNIFLVNAGDGNDNITIQPESFAAIAAMPTPVGWVFNRTPQSTTALVTVGNGNDRVDLESSGVVQVGSGTDAITLVDGVHEVWLGSGNDTVAISSHDLQLPATAAFSTQRDVNTIFFGSGHASVLIDDSAGNLTPLTNLVIGRGATGGGTDATADVIRYGHVAGTTGTFVGGDWSALSIELTGYSPGSTATLVNAPGGDHSDLVVQDAATGAVDMLALYGATPASLAALHVQLV